MKANENPDCITHADGTEECHKLVGPRYFWILMEAIAFYSYMGAITVYIAYVQIRNSCWTTHHSDLNKQIKDFLTYDRDNLVWFAFNFVLIILPACFRLGSFLLCLNFVPASFLLNPA